MTVSDLIERLRLLPQHLKVFVDDSEYDAHELKDIEVQQIKPHVEVVVLW